MIRVRILDKENNETSLEKNTTICIGDLHASAKKLIEISSALGAVSSDEAKSFVNLYNIAYQDFLEYEEDCSKLDFAGSTNLLLEFIEKMQVSSISNTIILLGDIIFDKGYSDIVILTLIKKLRQKINIKVILSNHDWAYFHTFENQKKYQMEKGYDFETFFNFQKNQSYNRTLEFLKYSEKYSLTCYLKLLQDHICSSSLFLYDKANSLLISHSFLSEKEDLKNTARKNLLSRLLDTDIIGFDFEEQISQANKKTQECIKNLIQFDKLDDNLKKYYLEKKSVIDLILWYANEKDEGSYVPSIIGPAYYVHGHYNYWKSLIPEKSLQFKTINLNDKIYRGVNSELYSNKEEIINLLQL